MPTYTFWCKKCKRTFEKVLRITEVRERERMVCDGCNARVELQITGGTAAFVQGGTPKFCSTEDSRRKWTGSPEQKRELKEQRARFKSKREGGVWKDGKLKPFWHEDLGPKPVYIESREQYRRELRKRNLANPSIGEYGQSH